MKALRNFLDSQHDLFAEGGKLEKFYPLYEMIDTFVYTPGETAHGSVHVRDAIDLKRLMGTVAIALIPCILMALYNTGYQANTVLAGMGQTVAEGWRGWILSMLGLATDPTNIISNVIHGALYFVPVFLVTQVAGGLCEVVFAVVRKHEINEGFLVTGMLYPLTLPPTIPLWQVAIGIIFGVVVGKEIFGGTGKNFLNPALTARAFLFFAYPAQISGDKVWTAVDGHSGATILSQTVQSGIQGVDFSFFEAFIGLIPGSMGETSTLACLLGAAYLIITGIGSWRIILSSFIGLILTTGLFFMMGSDTNLMFSMPPLWHVVVGGFAFGAVFMATDPVSASMTETGKWYYGFLIGFMVALIRVVNPAYPAGTMLAILFANCFAPLIDYFVVNANIKRRALRNV
ncbi:MAG: NADH:ubiquinone reductase (Na(+)-transporting) subunit B [Bdellovibrionota bacterium]|nr:NADH:ubiquinone reductase (Na(+)-transporting) subunit B [Bdellovibrionota bacterium]